MRTDDGWRFVRMACVASLLSLLPIAGWGQKGETATDSIAALLGAERPLYSSSYMLGIGGTQSLDTYLSQEHYNGTGITFLATQKRRRRPSAAWSTLMEHQANLSLLSDRANQTDEKEGSYRFFIGRLHRWQLLDNRLSLSAGGMAVLSLGFIYNTLGGNNPAQARVNLDIMPTGAASYRFQIGKMPFVAHYELQMPLVGLAFSPNYGQSYYEIFSRGDNDHNVVPTTFVSAPTFRQQFSVSTPLSRRWALRVGYLGDYEQLQVNHLKRHVHTHRVMMGIVKEFQLL